MFGFGPLTGVELHIKTIGQSLEKNWSPNDIIFSSKVRENIVKLISRCPSCNLDVPPLEHENLTPEVKLDQQVVGKKDEKKDENEDLSQSPQPANIEAPNLRPQVNLAFNNRLAQLNDAIIDIQHQYRAADKANNRNLRDQLTAQYNQTINEKIDLVIANVPKGPERFIAMALPGKIPAGTTFYHATRSLNNIHAILSEGVRATTTNGVETGAALRDNNFIAPELGQGLYLSQSGGYAGDGYNYALIMETTNEISTIKIEYRSSFASKEHYKRLELTEEDIRNGLTHLEENYDVIQREGLPPRDEEIAVRNPQHCFKPTSTGRWSDDEFSWVLTRNLTTENKWHDQWKEAPVAPVIPVVPAVQGRYETVAKIDDQGTVIIHDRVENENLFFKPLRGGQTAVVLAIEIGASNFANAIMGSLTPAAKRMELEGKEGIIQDAIEFKMKHLPGAIGTEGEIEDSSFDINQLTQAQLEQLFAHSLIDWAISNTDVQPHNFGIDKNDNVVAFDKAQAFKFFNGSKIQSQRANRGNGIESQLDRINPDFNQLQEERSFHVHALLRDTLRNKTRTINFEAPIIQQTIHHIQNLTKEDIGRYFSDYAQLAFPGQEQAFIDSVWDRCQDVPRAVESFKQSIR